MTRKGKGTFVWEDLTKRWVHIRCGSVVAGRDPSTQAKQDRLCESCPWHNYRLNEGYVLHCDMTQA